MGASRDWKSVFLNVCVETESDGNLQLEPLGLGDGHQSTDPHEWGCDFIKGTPE